MVETDTFYSLRDLWITRLFYFTLIGGGGFIAPFINIFYVHRGLTGSQIGLVVAIGSVGSLLAAPFWTECSSRNRRLI